MPVWPCYRLVLEKIATWTEVNTMSIDDVDLLNIAADAVFDALNTADPPKAPAPTPTRRPRGAR